MATTATPSGSFDFTQGFRFVFDDPDWIKKVLIGGVWTLLASALIGIPFVGGYAMRLTRNAARGERRPLPEWDDLGGLFGEGIQLFLVSLVYFLVIFVVPFGGLFAVLALTGALSAMGGRGDAASGLAAAVGAVGMIGFYLFFFLAMIAMCVFLPAALARVALTQRIGAGFELAEIWGFIRRNLGNYALAIVLYLVASFLAQFGIVLCCVGVFATSFWAYCVLAWGMGEVARLDRGASA